MFLPKRWRTARFSNATRIIRRRARVVVCAGVVGALLALASPPSRAAESCQPIPAIGPADGYVAAIDPERRLAWIDEALGRSARRTRTWTWGWGAALAAGTAGNLVPLAFAPPRQHIDWYTGSITTAVGIVPLVIAPLDVVGDSQELQARLAMSPRADVCILLADAETRFVHDAENQADGQRWWLHLANAFVNAGVGAFLVAGYRHWHAGIFNAAVGFAIGEAIILTQPTDVVDSLDRYRAGEL